MSKFTRMPSSYRNIRFLIYINLYIFCVWSFHTKGRIQILKFSYYFVVSLIFVHIKFSIHCIINLIQFFNNFKKLLKIDLFLGFTNFSKYLIDRFLIENFLIFWLICLYFDCIEYS